MTVKELIAELKKFPSDATVNFFYISSDGEEDYNNESEVTSVEFKNGEVMLR